MRYFIITDLEGVAGIDSFEHTRTTDEVRKAPAMDQLARETNACVAGIRDVHPDADIDVWDGHGPGGLRREDLHDATYLREGAPYFDLDGYDALLFVGQHAMAGSYGAPLAHTYSSREIAYYKLNGYHVGEFGCRALVAGLQGVPTVYLTGDDKAALEAEAFVPAITTTVTKWGTGLESADHLSRDEACKRVRIGASQAVADRNGVEPFDDIESPFELEIRRYDPLAAETLEEYASSAEVARIDERTVRLVADDIADLPV